MSKTTITWIFFLITIQQTLVHLFEVVDITEENYKNYKNKDNLVLYFHATWSSNSLKHKREFYSLAQTLEQNPTFKNQTMVFGIISNKAYKICREYEVKNYPSIYYIKDSIKYLYNGQVSSDYISDWIESKFASQIMKIDDISQLNNQINHYESIVLLYQNNDNNDNQSEESILKAKEEIKIYTNISSKFTDLPFYYTYNSSIVDHFNITSNSTQIFILKNYDEILSVFKQPINYENIDKFIKLYAYPLLNIFSTDNFMKVINGRITFSCLFMNNTNDHNELKNNFYEALSSSRMSYNMFGNYSDQSQTTLSIDFDLNKTQLPILILMDFELKNSDWVIKRYKADESDLLNVETIRNFFLKYQKKTLKRFLKSDKLNKDLIINNVYQLVGRNFEEVVMQEDKHVLVFFSRRACGLCIEFEKEFNSIAKNYEFSNLIFGRIDGLNNDIEDIVNYGYPSIILFKAGKNKIDNMVRFEDAYVNKEKLLNFLKTNNISLINPNKAADKTTDKTTVNDKTANDKTEL